MREPDNIIEAIADAQQFAWRAGDTLARAVVELGRRFAEARERIPREDWPKWVRENCHMTERTAGRYVKLFENAERDSGLIARALCGVLSLDLRDEVLLPTDDWHYSRAEDIDGRVLYLWRVKEDPAKLHVFVLDSSRGSFECSNNPPRREHVADIIAHRSPGGFLIGNSDWRVLPADETSLESLDAMRDKYLSRGERSEDA